jgi:hypothetical protein
MQIESNALIDDLLNRTENATVAARKFKQFPIDQLQLKHNAETWSMLECIEHLNLYGDYYLVEIEKQILSQNGKSKSILFKSGLIGNYFASLMLVKNGKMTKMKSPKDKNPIHSKLTTTTLDRFIKQQERLKSLLLQARNVDLTKTKTSISLTKYIKLRLGDTFRFFIYHIERHIRQAEKIYKK